MSNSIEDIPFCDVFHPSAEEFENFSEYLEKATKLADSGIFKVVPPKSWKARKDNYKNLDFLIPHPIEQIVNGKDGFYEVLLLQRESRQLSKYEKLVESFDKITENKKPVEVEKLFWKTLKFSSPLYGADAPGSLFDKGVKWNLTEIESLLKTGLGRDIKGVTTPYLYIGSWKSMFCWHKEDLDLYSINYLHFGRPKCWYGIPQEEHKKFEQFAKNHFPEAHKECPEFLRHKTYLIYPMIVKNSGITVHKCIQNPGEFVITKCASYHAGFNMGFNCAEAVNFALKNWIDYGKSSGYCKCFNDNVKIDINDYVQNLKSSRKRSHGSPVVSIPALKSKEDTKKLVSKSSPKNEKMKPAEISLINKKRKREETPEKKIESNSDKTEKQAKIIKTNQAKSFENSDGKIKPPNGLIKKKVPEENAVDNWVCCDNCNKWRKIPKNIKYDPKLYPNGFICEFIHNLDCQSAEENWRANYTTLKRKSYKHKQITRKELKEYYIKKKNSIKKKL